MLPALTVLHLWGILGCMAAIALGLTLHAAYGDWNG